MSCVYRSIWAPITPQHPPATCRSRLSLSRARALSHSPSLALALALALAHEHTDTDTQTHRSIRRYVAAVARLTVDVGHLTARQHNPSIHHSAFMRASRLSVLPQPPLDCLSCRSSPFQVLHSERNKEKERGSEGERKRRQDERGRDERRGREGRRERWGEGETLEQPKTWSLLQ